MPILITGIALFIVSLIIVIYSLSVINLFKRLIIEIDDNLLEIDQAIAKRFALFQDLFKWIKDDELMKDLMGKRLEDLSIKEKEIFASEIKTGLVTMISQIENDEKLRQNEDILLCFDLLHEIEDQLKTAQRKYNSTVSYYNQKIVIFPSHFIAKLQNYQKRDFIEIDGMTFN